MKNIVTDYSAVGDGVTDNSVAIQNALDQNGKVYAPEGIYAFSNTLILKRKQILEGDGPRTVFKYTGLYNAFEEPVGAYGVGGNCELVVKDLAVTTGEQTSLSGFKLFQNYQTRFDNVKIYGNFAEAGILIYSDDSGKNSAAIYINNSFIVNCLGDGIKVSGICGVAGLGVTQCHIQGNGKWGINITKESGYQASQISIISNIIEGNLGQLNLDVGIACLILANHFENRPVGTEGDDSTPIVLGNNGFIEGIEIRDNLINGVESVYLIDAGDSALFRGAVTGNHFLGNFPYSFSAINLPYGTKDLDARGNYLGDRPRYEVTAKAIRFSV